MGGSPAIRCRGKGIRHVAAIDGNVGDAVPVEVCIGAGPIETGSLPVRDARSVGMDEDDILSGGMRTNGKE